MEIPVASTLLWILLHPKSKHESCCDISALSPYPRDAQAQQIAANAQRFAQKYLNKKARTCYLLRYLT